MRRRVDRITTGSGRGRGCSVDALMASRSSFLSLWGCSHATSQAQRKAMAERDALRQSAGEPDPLGPHLTALRGLP